MSQSFATVLPPQFLEAINGVLLIIYAGILLIFLNYIWEGIKEYGWSEGYARRKAAIAITTFIFGDLLVRACIWSIRHMQNHYGWPPQSWGSVATVMSTLGAVICLVGSVCILRHFAPRKYGSWPSIVIISTALLFGIGLAF